MRSFSRIAFLSGFLTSLALVQTVFAAPRIAPTVITVEGMHCSMCAKKISGNLATVAGVETVSAQVEAGRMIVVSKAQQIPAPRALWDAVEKAGYRPVKLEGPSGTFTAKP